jgi:hypothetical protein
LLQRILEEVLVFVCIGGEEKEEKEEREREREREINIYTYIHATALFLGFCFQSLSASCEVTTMGSSCLTAFVSRL